MSVLSGYLKLPLTALRMALEAMDAPYTASERLHIYKVLMALRWGEIHQTRNRIISTEIFGFKVHAYDYTTLLFLFREIFLTRDYEFTSVNSSPYIIDCGANIGMSVFFHKYLHPNASIVCFEPNPTAYELLKLNVESNHLSNVTLRMEAVSDSNAPLTLFVNDDKGSLLSSVLAERGGSKSISIPAVLLTEQFSNTPAMIKIDVEGAEWNILNDLMKHQEKLTGINHIILEYHHLMEGSTASLSSFLKAFEDMGYKYNIRGTYKELGSFQDMILHFYR